LGVLRGELRPVRDEMKKKNIQRPTSKEGKSASMPHSIYDSDFREHARSGVADCRFAIEKKFLAVQSAESGLKSPAGAGRQTKRWIDGILKS